MEKLSTGWEFVIVVPLLRMVVLYDVLPRKQIYSRASTAQRGGYTIYNWLYYIPSSTKSDFPVLNVFPTMVERR